MKKTMAFVGGVLFAISVAACGSKAPAEETTPTPPADEMSADAGMGGDESMPAPSGEAPQGMTGNPCGGGAAGTEATGNPCGK